MTGQEFLESKDIWHHPLVSDRLNVKIYEVSDLLDEFLALQTKPNSGNTVLCGEGHNEAVIVNGDKSITNKQNEANTLTAPNELLPAEGLAKSVRGGVVFLCDNCMTPLPFLRKGNLCHNCA